MQFTQYYLDCLSHASYLIGDEGSGQAVVVDPRRDIAEYLADAEKSGLQIVGVINTHFHADFLAGHLELAKATGAWIGYGSVAETEYEIRALDHQERISLGTVELEVLHTPGHTPESISVVVREKAGEATPYGVLTGDTLFIGDVGRPDLLASIGVTAEQLAHQLYDSIQLLMTLPDETRVFPAHGAGSACGKNLSTARQSTIGEQRLFNYACQPMERDAFMAIVTEGQPPAPAYFVHDAILNRKDRAILDDDATAAPLSITDILARQETGALVLDGRDPAEFAAGHLRGAVNVPLDGRFSETAGMVVDPHAQVIVVAPEGRHDEVAVRLARIGFDHVLGYLPEPAAAMAASPQAVEQGSRLTVAQLEALLAQPEAPILIDVRNVAELEGGGLPGAQNIPLAQLHSRLDEVPVGVPVVVSCASGYRSSVAASFLRRQHNSDVSELLGGYAGWSALHPVAAN